MCFSCIDKPECLLREITTVSVILRLNSATDDWHNVNFSSELNMNPTLVTGLCVDILNCKKKTVLSLLLFTNVCICVFWLLRCDSKSCFFLSQLNGQILGAEATTGTYSGSKMAAGRYQRAVQQFGSALQGGGLGTWLRKPPELGHFNVSVKNCGWTWRVGVNGMFVFVSTWVRYKGGEEGWSLTFFIMQTSTTHSEK